MHRCEKSNNFVDYQYCSSAVIALVTGERETHARTHACARARIHTDRHRYTQTQARTHTHTHTHAHARTHARTHTNTHARAIRYCSNNRLNMNRYGTQGLKRVWFCICVIKKNSPSRSTKRSVSNLCSTLTLVLPQPLPPLSSPHYHHLYTQFPPLMGYSSLFTWCSSLDIVMSTFLCLICFHI